jgi:hypothetical protein
MAFCTGTITVNAIIKDSMTGWSDRRANEFPRSGKIERRRRLAGLLNYYYRAAA